MTVLTKTVMSECGGVGECTVSVNECMDLVMNVCVCVCVCVY